MKAIFEKLSRAQLVKLSGPGIHLTALSAWMYYVLSNVVRIDRKVPILSMPPVSTASDDGVDLEEYS